jgi:hypothetical protein
MLINFLIIGAQKAGTTSLLTNLDRLSEIYVPDDKEISCFYDDQQYNRRFIELPYEGYFSKWSGEKYVGNAPVNTLFFAEHTANNIHRYNPSIKLITILRDPVERAYSAYWYFVRLGLEARSFDAAIEEETDILSHGTFRERCDFTYISHGYYYEQLLHFYKYFDRSQILVLFHQDLKHFPESTFNRVCVFLGLPPVDDEQFTLTKHNTAAKSRIKSIQTLIYQDNVAKRFYNFLLPPSWRQWLRFNAIAKLKAANLTPYSYPPMPAPTEKFLRNTYKEPNDQLGSLLGRDLSSWNERH